MSKEDFLISSNKNPNTFKRGLLTWSNKDANTKIKFLQIEILNGLNLKSIDEKKATKNLIESNKYYLPSTYQIILNKWIVTLNHNLKHPKQINYILKPKPQAILCHF